MQTPFDTLFEQVQPDATEILAAPFLISDRISKRALLLLLRFQKIIICESAGIFEAQKPRESRLFLYNENHSLKTGGFLCSVDVILLRHIDSHRCSAAVAIRFMPV